MRAAALVMLASLAAPALAGPADEARDTGKGEAMDARPADARTLREADQALARAVEERDRPGFEARLAEDAWFAGGGRPLAGRAAVGDSWASFFEPAGPSMRWAPELGEISRSSDLGYTVGHYLLEARDANGRPVRREGRYLTVWRKEADGAFRVAVDAPLVPPADGAPEARRSPERSLSSRDGDLVVEAGTWRPASGSGRGGLYLVVRRRTREGVLATALETVVMAPE
jgi:ketosteroid isomerase-like protein